MTMDRGRLVALLALAAACGRGAPRGEDSTPVAETPLVAAEPPRAAGDTTCRLQGPWAWCSVEDRMAHAGVVMTRQDVGPTWDFLHGDGRAYKVGAGDDELHVYVYPDQATRQGDTDRLDSLAVAPKGERRRYRVQPLLVTSNNLAALVFSPNERTSERLANALSAGLPQPRP